MRCTAPESRLRPPERSRWQAGDASGVIVNCRTSYWAASRCPLCPVVQEPWPHAGSARWGPVLVSPAGTRSGSRGDLLCWLPSEGPPPPQTSTSLSSKEEEQAEGCWGQSKPRWVGLWLWAIW